MKLIKSNIIEGIFYVCHILDKDKGRRYERKNFNDVSANSFSTPLNVSSLPFPFNSVR